MRCFEAGDGGRGGRRRGGRRRGGRGMHGHVSLAVAQRPKSTHCCPRSQQQPICQGRFSSLRSVLPPSASAKPRRVFPGLVFFYLAWPTGRHSLLIPTCPAGCSSGLNINHGADVRVPPTTARLLLEGSPFPCHFSAYVHTRGPHTILPHPPMYLRQRRSLSTATMPPSTRASKKVHT